MLLNFKKKKTVLIVLSIFISTILLSYFSEKTKIISATTSQSVPIPSYYKSVKKMNDQLTLYSFNNIHNSSGKNELLYRVYDGNNLYNATASGEYEEKDILSADDISLEKPQPWISGTQENFTNDVYPNIVGPDVTIQYKFSGQYLFNYAGSYNGYGANATNAFGGFIYDGAENMSVPLLDSNYGSSKSILGTPDSSGNPKTFNLATGELSTSIEGNASKSTLNPSINSNGEKLNKSNIKAAYLIMEASVDVSSSSYNTSLLKQELQNVCNRPMTLVGPSKENCINSNGYLPKNFLLGYDKSIEETSSKQLTSDTPTVLYSLGGGNGGGNGRIRGTTITDVTDFVKTEGYGTYYGYHIPTKSTIKSAADVATGWKLIVIEEDPTMSYKRSGILELGIINSNNSLLNNKNIDLHLDLNNYTTPVSDDFSGQLFFSSVGSNPQAKQYLVRFDAGGSENENSYALETRDRSGTLGEINRNNTSASFGQNIITIDGQRRTDMSSYRLAPSGSSNPAFFSLTNYQNKTQNYTKYTDGMDIELLNITNRKPNLANLENTHNAYITNAAKGINLSISPSPDGDNFITALGVMTQIESPTFASSITHTSLDTGTTDSDLSVEELFQITATTKNVTSEHSTIKGVTDTQVEISLDTSIDVSWETMNLKFLNDGSNSDEFTEVATLDELNRKTNNTFFIDKNNNKVIVNFGTKELFYSSYESLAQGKTEEVYLYNNSRDELQLTVTARTSKNEKTNLENNIHVTAKNLINNEGIIAISDDTNYSNAYDKFNSYGRDIYLHLRQIVINTNENVIIPQKGYGTILCSSSINNNNLAEFNIELGSSAEKESPFLSTVVQYPINTSLINYHSLIPEYYQLEGYVVSDNLEEQSFENIIDKVAITVEQNKHYWVTTYIKPSTNSPAFYHWDYKKNDLGTISSFE